MPTVRLAFAVWRTIASKKPIESVILLASWKVLEKADRKPGIKPEDTPFSVIAKKILGPAIAAGIVDDAEAHR